MRSIVNVHDEGDVSAGQCDGLCVDGVVVFRALVEEARGRTRPLSRSSWRWFGHEVKDLDGHLLRLVVRDVELQRDSNSDRCSRRRAR